MLRKYVLTLTAVKEISMAKPPAPPMAKGTQGTIAVTVRLDPTRYERMKLLGARRRRTNQDMLVAALDAYLDVNAEYSTCAK